MTEVVKGFGCVDAPKCAHCGEFLDWPLLEKCKTLVHCGKCGKYSTAQRMATPVGPAWVTNQVHELSDCDEPLYQNGTHGVAVKYGLPELGIGPPDCQ